MKEFKPITLIHRVAKLVMKVLSSPLQIPCHNLCDCTEVHYSVAVSHMTSSNWLSVQLIHVKCIYELWCLLLC
jgi:hypothetical protein